MEEITASATIASFCADDTSLYALLAALLNASVPLFIASLPPNKYNKQCFLNNLHTFIVYSGLNALLLLISLCMAACEKGGNSEGKARKSRGGQGNPMILPAHLNDYLMVLLTVL